MARLRYIKQTLYDNKCAVCGKTIIAKSEAYWNGLAKAESKNYHIYCAKEKGLVSSSPGSTNPSAGKQTGRKEEGGNPDRVSPNSQTGSTQASLPEFDVIDNLKQALLIANGAGFALGIPGVSAIVQEIMRERFELYLEQRKEKFWGKRID